MAYPWCYANAGKTLQGLVKHHRVPMMLCQSWHNIMGTPWCFSSWHNIMGGVPTCYTGFTDANEILIKQWTGLGNHFFFFFLLCWECTHRTVKCKQCRWSNKTVNTKRKLKLWDAKEINTLLLFIYRPFYPIIAT